MRLDHLLSKENIKFFSLLGSALGKISNFYSNIRRLRLMFKYAILAGFVGAALFDLIKYIIRKVRKNK